MEALSNLRSTEAKVRIIAIDPGSTESAFLTLDNGIISSFGKISNLEMLAKIHFSRSFEYLVIEQIASYGMSVGEEVFETVYWSGRFAQLWCPGDTHRIKRHAIKMHLCKDSRAKDTNIRQALIDRYGKQGTKKNQGPTYGISGDCWSALAVATTFYDLNQSKL